jgi:hypothetical protein
MTSGMEHRFAKEQQPDKPPGSRDEVHARRERAEELEATAEVFRALGKQPQVAPTGTEWRVFSTQLKQRVAAVPQRVSLGERIQLACEMFRATDSAALRALVYAVIAGLIGVSALLAWYVAETLAPRPATAPVPVHSRAVQPPGATVAFALCADVMSGPAA